MPTPIRRLGAFALSLLVCAVVFLLALWLFTASIARGQATQPSVTTFGVWFQPLASFDKWKSRGVNVLFGYEGEGGAVTRDQWCAAARAKGLRYVLIPDWAHFDKDAADPGLAGWLVPPDEPNSGKVPPKQIQDECAALKLAGPTIPRIVTIDGWKAAQWEPDADLAAYLTGATIAMPDYHWANRGEQDTGPANEAKCLANIHRVAPWLSAVWLCVETGPQDLDEQAWWVTPELGAKMRGPKVEQIQKHLSNGATASCTGYVLFPTRVGVNFKSFDSTPDDAAVWLAKWARANVVSTPPVPPTVEQRVQNLEHDVTTIKAKVGLP